MDVQYSNKYWSDLLGNTANFFEPSYTPNPTELEPPRGYVWSPGKMVGRDGGNFNFSGLASQGLPWLVIGGLGLLVFAIAKK